MSVLITGASGSTGREIVRACRGRGLGVVIGAAAAAPARGIRRLDLLERSTWPAALDGCAQVVVLRPPASVGLHYPMDAFIDAALKRGVTHLMLLSVPGAGEDAALPEYATERHLEKAGTDWTILRPGYPAQSLSDLYHTDIMEDDRLYVPAGKGEVAFVDLRDVGDLTAAILADPGEHRRATYTLTGPSTFTFADAAELLSTATERPIAYVRASTLGYSWHLWRKRGLPFPQVRALTAMHHALRRGGASQVDDTLTSLLGRPARSLADYVEAAAATWWTAEPDEAAPGNDGDAE
jgi:uncharacterized protein YbjT (DUF2867 family)